MQPLGSAPHARPYMAALPKKSHTLLGRERWCGWLFQIVPNSVCNFRVLNSGGLVAKSCPTLCNFMDCSSSPLSMGFSRQECWSGLPCPSPGDLPDLGIKLRFPELLADSLPSEPLGKPKWTISSVQSLSRVQLFATPWIAAWQASLSITNSRSSLRLTSIESVMPSSRLILCCPLLLLPPIPPSIRVFSNESTLRMRWPKYWRFSFNIIPSKEHPGLITFRMDWLDLLAVQMNYTPI